MQNRPKAIAILAVFGYTWLMIGFATGTATLLFPARWLTNLLRQHGAPATFENFVMTVVILLFLVVSAYIARAIVRATLRAQRVPVRFGIPLVVTGLAAFSMWAWLNPDLVNGAESIETVQLKKVSVGRSTFVFGPYPTHDRLERLKREHFVGDISLLHPA